MSFIYPFCRTVNSKFNQSENILSITGQLITEKFEPRELSEPSHVFETRNPQVLEISYLLRYELENIFSRSLSDLLEQKNRSIEDILRAATIVREMMWEQWEEMKNLAYLEGDDCSHYFTGVDAEAFGTKSLRAWAIYSDPFGHLESAPKDWLEQKIWRVNTPYTWGEILLILSLWAVDESAVYLNRGNPYKASTWLVRAIEYTYLAKEDQIDLLGAAKKSLASSGGIARRNKYQPLKDFVLEKVKLKNYPSRRNAALSLAPEVINKARELNIGLSAQQAEITITNWLKQYGLPANI